jgi:hypothetical protein
MDFSPVEDMIGGNMSGKALMSSCIYWLPTVSILVTINRARYPSKDTDHKDLAVAGKDYKTQLINDLSFFFLDS